MTAELTPEQEEEVASGLLPFQIDGKTRYVPELKRTPNREWKARLQTTFATLVGIPTDTVDGQQAMADAEAELVMAYDVTHTLGDLEDATEREVDAIYNRLIEVAFPKAQGQMALMVGIIQAAAASALASSTNGASPTGTSAPTILTPRSRSARSSSSTRRRKSA
jgi:hypothetical protein